MISTKPPEIREIDLLRYECMRSLLFFTRYQFKKKHNRKFIVGEHHRIICEALERVLRGEVTRLIINIAPRYGKTELAVKNFIAHGLALNSAAKFIHLTYADKLALDNSEEAKDIVQSQEYQELFPHVKIKKDSKAKNKWYTTAGGGVYAAAAGGQVTGFGAGSVDNEQNEDNEASLNEFISDIDSKAGFSGAIIIDDPIKPEDATSPVKRERVNNRFETTIRNRVNSRRTPIIVIGQRVDVKDLSGYLQVVEPEEWTVISLPCMFVGTDGELQALWDFKHTVDELKKLSNINPFVFETQYQQNPKPKEGLLFPESELNFYNPATVDVEKLAEYKFCFIDPADSGSDSLSAPVAYLIGNKIYITDVIFNTDGTDVNEPACIELICSKRLNACHIEGNSAWVLFGKAVRNKAQERYQDCEIRIVKAYTNKENRIFESSAFIRNHFVFRKDYKEHAQYYKFMQNITAYARAREGQAKNQHDDGPDSCAGIAKFFRENYVHLW